MSTSNSIPRQNRTRARVWIGACAGGMLFLSALAFLPAVAAVRLAVVPSPQAAFDYDPITSLKANPTITGSATSSVPLHFQVLTKSGAVAYDDASVLAVGNRFTETIFPPIANGTYTLKMFFGSTTLASTTLTVGLRTEPNIESDDSIASYDVADGHLMRFRISAQRNAAKAPTVPTPGIGINQLTFTVVPTNADVEDIGLYVYSDSGFTEPIIASSTGPLNSVPVEISATSSTIIVVPDQPIEIPSGATYYFDLVGTVTPSDLRYNVLTTLLPDTNLHFGAFDDMASTSNFVWSPNTYGTTSVDQPDWTSGALVAGIPTDGLQVVRTEAPPTNAATCTLVASTSTAPQGTPLTLTWNTIGATTAVWDSGLSESLSGSKTYTTGSTTHTYILTVTGQYGWSNCFATVIVPQLGKAATTTGTMATTTDGFTATPTTGTAPLAVTFTGSVNNNKSCAAQTFSLGYGDGATSTIAVAKNICTAVPFTLVHSYTKVGTFTAGLYSGTGTSTKERIQTQVITPKTKVAFLFDPSSNLANVFSGAGSSFLQAFGALFGLFNW